MAAANASNDDCYYYYYSLCTRGAACSFRHEPAARGNETVCSYWKAGNCTKPHCAFRHLDVSNRRKSVPCFFESTPGGCKNPQCTFVHSGPRAAANTNAVTAAASYLAEALSANKTVIVSQKKMQELQGVLGQEVKATPAADRGGPVPLSRRLGARTGVSVKDRLGRRAGEDDGDEEEENVEVFEYSDDSEAEELRASAIKTLDLRKRLATREPAQMSDGAVAGEEVLEDQQFVEEYRKGQLQPIEVVKKEKKKDRKERKAKKKEKKEKREKKTKKSKAAESNDDQSAEHRRIVTRVVSDGEGERDGDELDMSLADRVAAMNDKAFAVADDAKTKRRVSLGVAGEEHPRDVDLRRERRRSRTPERSRKRRKAGDEGGEAEEDSPARKARRSSGSRRRSESPKKRKKGKSSKRKEEEVEDGKDASAKPKQSAVKDLKEVEKFLKENPEVNSSMDVMKELDELLQD